MARDATHPQHGEMSDESMVRTLAAQAGMIWPQEAPLFQRYGLSGPLRILDVGCGTGDVTHELAALYPEAEVTGIDIVEAHLAMARERYASYGERLRFEVGDAFDLAYADGSFDLVVCRHMLQSVTDQPAVVAELHRVLVAGGRLHLLAEDYHMISAEPADTPDGPLDPDRFWADGPVAFGEHIGTDLRIGRRAFGILQRLGFQELSVEFLTVDTLRCDRGVFADMMVAWRDGFAESIASETRLSEAEALAHFDAIIATIRDPGRYAVWQVPVWSAVR